MSETIITDSSLRSGLEQMHASRHPRIISISKDIVPYMSHSIMGVLTLGRPTEEAYLMHASALKNREEDHRRAAEACSTAEIIKQRTLEVDGDRKGEVVSIALPEFIRSSINVSRWSLANAAAVLRDYPDSAAEMAGYMAGYGFVLDCYGKEGGPDRDIHVPDIILAPTLVNDLTHMLVASQYGYRIRPQGLPETQVFTV